MNRTIVYSDIEPAPLSIRHPLGIKLDLNVKVMKQDGSPLDVGTILPQLVLLPRSRGGTRPYDMDVIDAVNGNIRVEIPGYDLGDVSGYGLEIYTRTANPTPEDPPLPTGLLATGTLVTQGAGYATTGPMTIINVQTVVGPPGPTGPTGLTGPVGDTGQTGQRGSVWYTGTGVPVVPGEVLPGDMYLDEANGDVYRYDGETWVRGTFG